MLKFTQSSINWTVQFLWFLHTVQSNTDIFAFQLLDCGASGIFVVFCGAKQWKFNSYSSIGLLAQIENLIGIERMFTLQFICSEIHSFIEYVYKIIKIPYDWKKSSKDHYNLKTADLLMDKLYWKFPFKLIFLQKLVKMSKLYWKLFSVQFQTVVKIIFITVLTFSQVFIEISIWKGIFSTLCLIINLQCSNCNGNL